MNVCLFFPLMKNINLVFTPENGKKHKIGHHCQASITTGDKVTIGFLHSIKLESYCCNAMEHSGCQLKYFILRQIFTVSQNLASAQKGKWATEASAVGRLSLCIAERERMKQRFFLVFFFLTAKQITLCSIPSH